MRRGYKLVYNMGQWLEDVGWSLAAWGRLRMLQHVLRWKPASIYTQDDQVTGIGC